MNYTATSIDYSFREDLKVQYQMSPNYSLHQSYTRYPALKIHQIFMLFFLHQDYEHVADSNQ